MRWVLIILFLLPTKTVADKYSRDKIIQIMSDVMSCSIVLAVTQNGAYASDQKQVQQEKSLLIMQYEINENFNPYNLNKLYLNMTRIFKNTSKKSKRLGERLEKTELDYLQIKMNELGDAAENLADNVIKDPVSWAKEIQRCTSEYNLGD